MSLPPDEQRQARVVRELIHAAGGVEACERDREKSKSLFSAYQSPNDPRSMPLDDIEFLESVTHGKLGHPHVTRYLARQAGCVLLPRPEVPRDRSDIITLLARQARERGECDPELLTALADGNIDEDEAERLIPMMRQRLETDAHMLAQLEAIAGRSVS
ncbi:hypothetical protein [Pelagerythrobacter sp.]|uniref:hypothetical protein n=1 Tax=Pelagerythrobacter sp. TaxID=2800702 RepID=UPI0035B127C1